MRVKFIFNTYKRLKDLLLGQYGDCIQPDGKSEFMSLIVSFGRRFRARAQLTHLHGGTNSFIKKTWLGGLNGSFK